MRRRRSGLWSGGTLKYEGYVDVAATGLIGKAVTLWTLKDFNVERPAEMVVTVSNGFG